MSNGKRILFSMMVQAEQMTMVDTAGNPLDLIGLPGNNIHSNSLKNLTLVTNKKDITRNPSISINGTLLGSCEKYKYLGVVIDKNLTWKPQIEHVCKKISKACGAIAKLRHCMSTKLLVEVYLSWAPKLGVTRWLNHLKDFQTTFDHLKS